MGASLIVTLIVIGVLVLFFIVGYRRGFLRVLFSAIALILTIVIAGALTPAFSKTIQKSFIGKSAAAGIEKVLTEKMSSIVVQPATDASNKVINALPIPGFLKETLVQKNTVAGLAEAGASTFKDYLSNKLVSFICTAVAFIILLIAIYIALRILFKLINGLAKIPGIKTANKLLGGCLGLLEGLLVLWILGFVIMAIAGTAFGLKLLEVINGNAFLKFLYENNGLALVVDRLFKMF